MHLRSRLSGVALLFSLLSLLPAGLLAQKGGGGFRLFARASGALTINNVYCGLNANGEICVDSTNSTTVGGGYWPKNSPQQYVYNSGIQVAGIIEDIGGWAWAGDTTGAFFFDAKGTTQHGQELEPVWNYANSADRVQWPAAAQVPTSGPDAALYEPSLRGRATASEGDIWTLAWEGDPALIAGRSHPLGVAVETRGLGWNFPAGNQDILYFVHTFYNISSTCAADYADIRPAMREELLALGHRFQALNEERFGIQVPECGYGIAGLHVGSAYDADVSSDAGNNYGSANLPLALGYTYEDTFRRPEGSYTLPAGIGDPPFTNGYGFVGIKFLRTLPVTGAGPELVLYSNSGKVLNDPANVAQLFRYLTGRINPSLGDGLCNQGDPLVTHICAVKSDGHSDSRGFLSTGPASLSPGGSVSLVVAYLFASAVASPGCPAAGCPSVIPGNPRWLSNPAQLLSGGANLIDSLTGFRGFVDDNFDGQVQGSEFRAVRGSLIQKAQMAQAIFDEGFLLPAPPEAPDFFLVPGSDQVTVVWRPSATEVTGDGFFAAASPATSPMYDPNYRQFDVEGYRIYRGRSDAPAALTLVARFDHAEFDTEGHPLALRDHLGAVKPVPTCAPELGRNTIAEGCPVDFDDPPAPNAPYTTYVEHPIVSPFVQVRLGDRHLVVGSGLAYLESADTAVTGGATGLPDFWDTGVPFMYVDSTARNNLRYFYAVTAFDINSIQSGPSSLESARITKGVTPVRPASNYRANAAFSAGVRGRGVLKDPAAPLPSLDLATGQFNGPMPPADGTTIELVGTFVAEIVDGNGSISVRLDSLHLGQTDLTGCCGGGGPGVPAHYYFTISSAAGSLTLDLPVEQELGNVAGGTRVFDAIPVDAAFGARYGGDASYALLASFTHAIQPVGFAGGIGLGAALGEPGLQSFNFAAVGTTGMRYDGFRWFSGANESFAHPTAGHCGTGIAACAVTTLANFNNAGAVSGATLVYQPRGYLNFNREWRNMEVIMSSARRAADVRVYWGAAGVVDSVIDLTHNVPLTFDSAGGTDPNTQLAGGWGILNQAATTGAGSYDGRPGTLTPLDWTCVKPFKSFISGGSGFFPCAVGTEYAVSRTAVLGPVAVGAGDNQSTTNAASVRTATNNNGGNGFSMYVAGTITFFGGMAALPSNTSWTLRTYSGAVFGGAPPGGVPGALGPYRFISAPRPMTAVGAEVVFNYTVTQTIAPATQGDLRQVHTVPDPYYITSGYETDPRQKVIKFMNLPDKAIVRIYTTSGILVRVIEHASGTLGGEESWDVRNRDGRLAASGVYFYHIEAPSGARRVGRMTIVTYGR